MAKAAEPEKVGTRERFKQIGMVIAMTAKGDRKFIPIVAGVVAVPLIALVLLLVLGSWSLYTTILLVVGMIVVALVGFMIVLNTRSNNVFMKQAEETPGAAAQIVENIQRGDWRVTPALASTTSFDMVHLVICRKGVLLIGEGNPSKVRQMMGQEKRRLAKVIGSAEMKDIIIGNGEGETPVRKLRTTLVRMPNTISAKDVNALDVRLKALTARPQMPKGAIPKNMRPSTGAFRAPRGR
jgi:Domain of unknown function (DUF4191)